MTAKTTREGQYIPELLELAETYPSMIGYPEAAKLTGSSVRTLKRLTDVGDLPCYRVGRARVLRLRTLDVLALVRRVA